MRTKSSRVGFTLVELLVVIGIIALLISILLPALSKARKQAMIITDLSNMRQVGLAVNMYANDNKGRLPGGYGNAGGYMHSHEIVRQRLYGETFDFGTLQSVKGGTAYLKSSMLLPGPDAWGPSSKAWGCPMTGDSTNQFRYGASWWWNAGAEGTCDSAGRMIYCRQSDPTKNWWQLPGPVADPSGNHEGRFADGFALFITGKGYAYDTFNGGTLYDNNNDRYANGRKVNPDDIVLINCAGAPNSPGFAVGHLRANPGDGSNVEGTCTLFLSGRAMWRTRSQLQSNVWIGQADPVRTACR